jgi:Na+/pantothenate symporter
MILAIIVIAIYFSLLIAIGFIGMIKTKTVEDLYVGGMRIGGIVTALSFFTTYFSSVIFIGATALGWKYGLPIVWKDVFVVLIGTTLAFIFLGPRLRNVAAKLKALSVIELIEKRFESRQPSLAAAMAMMIGLTVYAISILIGTARALEVIMGMDYNIALLATAIIVLIYTALGGYLGQVWTQAFQAIFMLFMAIVIAFVSMINVGGFTGLSNTLSSIDLALVRWPYRDFLPLFMLYLSLGFLGWGNPALLMRFISIRDRISLKNASVIATTLVAILTLSLNLASAASRVIISDVKVPDYAFLYLVQRIFPTGFDILFLVAILSASMSTIAPMISTLTQIIVKDLGIFKRGKNNSDGFEFKLYRIMLTLVTILCILFSLNPPPMLIVLFGVTTSILSGVLTGPMIYILFWRKTTATAITTSIIAGLGIAITVAAYGGFKFPWTYYSFAPTIIASFIIPPIVSMFTKPPPKRLLDEIFAKC